MPEHVLNLRRGRTARSYAILDVSAACYEEIRAKLEAAGYDHAFVKERGERDVVDMQGVALRCEATR